MATLQQAIDSLNAAATAYNGKIASINTSVAQAKTDFNTLTPARWIEDVITINGDVNYLYPVWWTMPPAQYGETLIEISRSYYENKLGLVGGQVGLKNNAHVYSLLMQLEGNSSAYGGDANSMQIKRFNENYDVGCSDVAFLMHVNAASSIAPAYSIASGCYLRGGGLTYHIRRNQNMLINYQDGSLGVNGLTTLEIGYYVKPIFMGIKDPVTGIYPNIKTPVRVINPGLTAV